MQASFEHIKALLESGDVDQVREGAFIAGKDKVIEAIPLLVKNIEFLKPAVQEPVEEALRQIGGMHVLHAVLPNLKSEEASVRNISMDLLRSVVSSDVLAIAGLLDNEDPDLRIFGADILGSSGSILALTALCSALLKDPEVNVRYQAAVSLGQLGFSESVNSLNRALADEEWVQFAVVESLTKIKAESSVTALLKALGKCTNLVAASIIDALGEIGYIKAVPVLMNGLSTASRPLAIKISCAIIKILGLKSLELLGEEAFSRLLPFLIEALSDDDFDSQNTAVVGLSLAHGENEFLAIFQLLSRLDPVKDTERIHNLIMALSRMGYHHVLEDALESKSEQTANFAVAVLSRIGDEQSNELLKKCFKNQLRDVQRNIITVLVKKGNRDDKDFFLDVLENNVDSKVLKSAIIYFGKLGDSSIIEQYILPLFDHPYDDIKETAIDAAVCAPNERIVELFQHMTKHEHELKRTIAIYALGKCSVQKNMEYLKRAVSDPSPYVRRAALEALASGPVEKEILPLINPCIEDESTDVRIAAVDVLCACKSDEATPYILKAVNDDDPWVRARCAECLVSRGGEVSSEYVTKFLNDDQALVVIKTIEVLRDKGGSKAFTILLPLLNHHLPEVQYAAEMAIAKLRDDTGV